jgi:hypothetical protein
MAELSLPRCARDLLLAAVACALPAAIAAAEPRPFAPLNDTVHLGGAVGSAPAPAAGAEDASALPGATSPLMSVEMSASPAAIALGVPCTVTVTYRWPAAWPVRGGSPDPGAAFAGEYVTEAPPPDDLHAGGQAQRTVRLSVLPMRSGPWELPRPAFTCDAPEGVFSARAPAVEVAVGVADEAPPPPPRPLRLRPPVPPPGRWWPWLAGAAALVALAGAAFALGRGRQRAAAAITPWERLASDLGHADRAGDGKEAGALLSLALRRYAGAVWSFDGPGSTAREVGQALRGRAPGDEARDLARLLDGLDGLRWAAGDLPASAIATLREDARAWTRRVQARLDAEAAAAEKRGAATTAAGKGA